MIHTDQMGNEIIKVDPFKRVLSLVPSQTELLVDLIGVDRVVGRTKFCIHPHSKVKQIPVIGGTKKFNFRKIDEIRPDLIIGNKEENYEEGIEELQQKYPVWMSDVFTLEDNYDMITRLGQLLDADKAADRLISQTKERLQAVENSYNGRVLYFIWQDPFIVAGRNTFIDHLLRVLGFENTCIQMRYPEMDQYILEKLNPDYIFLSSEPYPFKEKHIRRFGELFPNAIVKLVDGEMFSWYGSRLLLAGKYFRNDFLSFDKIID